MLGLLRIARNSLDHESSSRDLMTGHLPSLGAAAPLLPPSKVETWDNEEAKRMSTAHGDRFSSRDDDATPDNTASVAPHRPGLSRRKRLAFCAMTLILSWLLCEIGAFLLLWLWLGRPFSWAEAQNERRDRANRPEGSSANVFSEVHPYVGFVEEPRSDSRVHRSSDGQEVPVSEFGYIDDKEPIQARGPDRIVVAILGGSIACYLAVNGTERLEAVLANSPVYAGKHFVFVNLALGGYKQPQQVMTLAYLLSLGAEFDLVLNIDGFNEVALYELENASHHIFPAFPRSWQARVGTTDPVMGLTRGRLLVIEEQRTELARWHSRAPWRYSVLYNLLWSIRDGRLAWEAYHIQTDYSKAQVRRGPYAVTGPRRDFANRAELYEHLAAIWTNSSILLNRLCSERGMRYFHFLQPNQYLPGSKPMGEEEKRMALWMEHPYRRAVELGYPLLIRNGRALKEQGIPFYDLTGIFRDHPEATYGDTCCHLNQAGLDLMAQAIARAILDSHPTASGK